MSSTENKYTHELMKEWQLFSLVKQSVLEDKSLRNLIGNYEKFRDMDIHVIQLKKLFAELCFLIASEYKSINCDEKATEFAHQAIGTYEAVDVQTLEDAAPVLSILLPSLMHEDVVRERLLK